MNLPTVTILILFVAFVAIVVCFMWRKGTGSCCHCDRCGNSMCKKHHAGILVFLFAMASLFSATAQNPNERLSFIMKDGTAYRLLCNKVAGLTAVKMDQQMHATKDYEGLLIAPKDGQAALLPLRDIVAINHINGEPTDGAYGAQWYEIQREWNEHAEVVMLNSINNYNNGVGVITQQYDNNWCGQREMYIVGFLATCDMGYEVNFSIRGLDTGYDYTNINGFVLWLPQNAEGNTFGQGCWTFPMPPEPIVITATATENTDYDQHPWLGNYYGFPMPLTEDFFYTGSDATATRLSLKGNKSYIFSSTDTENVTSSMEYTYEDGKFTYKPDESGDLSWRGDQTYYGLTGYWVKDDLIYLRADDINVDKPENARRFFMLQNGDQRGFSVSIGAKDNWNGRSTQYLAELTYDGAKHYYYMNNYGAAIYEAEVSFTKGTTIAEGCEAVVTYIDNSGSEQKFSYITEDGKNPKFEEYKEPNHNLPESAEWTGPKAFQNLAAHGTYDGKEGSNHRIYVYIDKNPYGSTDKPGYCSLRVDFNTGTGRYTDVISTSGTYVYNPAQKTLTVTGMLLADEGSSMLTEHTVVFNVGEGLTTLTLDPTANGETLRGSRTNTYIFTGSENAVSAIE